MALAVGEDIRVFVYDIPYHVVKYFPDALLGQHLIPVLVYDAALLVHHIVVFYKMLPYIEIMRLHPFLGRLDGPRDQPVLDGHALGHAEFLHEAGYAVEAEMFHEVVLQRQEKPALAGIALTAATAPELVVYSS